MTLDPQLTIALIFTLKKRLEAQVSSCPLACVQIFDVVLSVFFYDIPQLVTFFLLELGSEISRFCPKEGHTLRASEIQTKLPP